MYRKLVPTGFHSYVKQGGSTKPWLIDLQEETGENTLYIVKPFTLRNNQQIAATAKEIFGNLLAQEFDLPIPTFAVTNFSNQFTQTFLNAEQQTELAVRDPNWKYASQFIEGASIFNLQRDRQRLREYDIAKLYAFNCLCFNLDRGGFRDKPNLLVDDESFWLIDHEQIFPFTCNSDHFKYFEKVVADFKNETTSYQYHRHLFYGILKQLGLKQKKDLFEETIEYVRNLNLKPLSDAAHQMEVDGILAGQWKWMVHYLAIIKAEPAKAAAILQKSIL